MQIMYHICIICLLILCMTYDMILQHTDTLSYLLMMELQARDLWSNTLSDVERGCSPIVYKLLEFELVHEIFGRDPWRDGLLPATHRFGTVPVSLRRKADMS